MLSQYYLKLNNDTGDIGVGTGDREVAGRDVGEIVGNDGGNDGGDLQNMPGSAVMVGASGR